MTYANINARKRNFHHCAKKKTRQQPNAEYSRILQLHSHLLCQHLAFEQKKWGLNFDLKFEVDPILYWYRLNNTIEKRTNYNVVKYIKMYDQSFRR